MLAPMARTLFGTDGVRGVVGEKITADLARSLGRAATTLSPARAPRVLIIRDPRESGEMLESALAAGVAPPAARRRSAASSPRRPRRWRSSATATTSRP